MALLSLQQTIWLAVNVLGWYLYFLSRHSACSSPDPPEPGQAHWRSVPESMFLKESFLQVRSALSSYLCCCSGLDSKYSSKILTQSDCWFKQRGRDLILRLNSPAELMNIFSSPSLSAPAPHISRPQPAVRKVSVWPGLGQPASQSAREETSSQPWPPDCSTTIGRPSARLGSHWSRASESYAIKNQLVARKISPLESILLAPRWFILA